MVTFCHMMITILYNKMFLILQIRIVPDGFHEYLQHRVQMGYEYEKYKKEEGKHSYGYDLQEGDGDVRKETRYHKRKNDENNGGNKCSDIYKEKGEIEVKSYIEITERHPHRKTE